MATTTAMRAAYAARGGRDRDYVVDGLSGRIGRIGTRIGRIGNTQGRPRVGLLAPRLREGLVR